jgi:hypothetical protein
VKYTEFLNPLKGPAGGGGGGKPPMLVGTGSPVEVRTELLEVIVLLSRFVGVMLILPRLVEELLALKLRLKLLVGSAAVLVGVSTKTSVVPVLELDDAPIVVVGDRAIQESLPLPLVTFGATA